VFYSKEENRYDQKAVGEMTNYTFYDYKSGYIHHCLVDGLEVIYLIFYFLYSLHYILMQFI
jgi:hypothetical protein